MFVSSFWGPRRSLVTTVVLAGLAITSSSDAQVDFLDVGGDRGIGPYTQMTGMGGGVAAADFDDDGDIDVFVPNGVGVADQLYRNLGDGTFEEVADDVGLASLDGHRVALWLDYDGDHDLDLVVAGDCFVPSADPCADAETIHLYSQTASGMFEDVTIAAGLDVDWGATAAQHRSGISAGDINNDGYLDLYIGRWSGPDRLLLNTTTGGFTDITRTSGIFALVDHWQSMFYDFNGDGWIDIYSAIDFAPNRLYINQQDNTFLDVAADAGADNAMNDMGLTLGDYDNDGDFDIYVTNVYQEAFSQRNVLLRNDSTEKGLSFTEVSEATGVANGWWGWGTIFADIDNDGRLDILATNGFMGVPWSDDPSRFFYNLGGDPVTFADFSESVGFDDTDWGSALITADFDRDGALDVVQSCNVGGPLRFLENDPGVQAENNNTITIRPRMDGPNHRAIGAVVHVSAGGTDLMRLISAGTSFLGQVPAEVVIGVGIAPVADTVTIDWPDGTQTTWSDVELNTVYTLVPGGTPGDIDMNGSVDFDDLLAVLAAWGPCVACAEDLTEDGEVGFTDILVVLSNWG